MHSRWLRLLLPLIFSFALSTVLYSAVQAPPIPTLFTDNVGSTGTTTDVTDMEQVLLDLIDSAATSIDLSIYDFNRVSIRDALISARGRGVTVRVVTDDDARENPSYKPHYDALGAAGATIVDDGRPGDIMHNKFVVVDDLIVWTGSTNLTNNGFTKNHNNSVLMTSTVLADVYTVEFEKMFGGDFSTAKTASVTNAVSYNGIPIELYFSPKDDALDQVVAAVDTAQTDIVFTIFFFTDDRLRDALIAAKGRGVRVRGVWDLLGASNSYSDDEALCGAGVPIKIETWIGKMHNKFMVIDAAGSDPTVITGSMNWTGAGDRDNDENTLLIFDSTTAGAYAAAFETLWDALPADTACVDESQQFAVYLPTIIGGTSPPPEADIQLDVITYNPDGSDVAGEVVKIDNRGNASQPMTGWTLADAAGSTFTFPAYTLAAGASVHVWVGSGTDDAANLFWGRNSAVWNNSGDTATLRNAMGAVIDSCAYSGGGEAAFCP